jgi:hyaluronoglucosaminidase
MAAPPLCAATFIAEAAPVKDDGGDNDGATDGVTLPATHAILPSADMSAFAHRGIIEGFYGPPYSHVDRLWLIDRLGAWGLNCYVYAPKDDPLHRAQWRASYPAAARREFAELIERGRSVGVDVGFAISPGLTIEYAALDDVHALQAKFRSFQELGARWFCLALDDVPTSLLHTGDEARFGSLAAAHVALAHAVADAVGPEATLWVVPTDYVGVEPTDYLEVLGSELSSAIEIGWTGRTVISPSISAAEAEQRARTLRRRVLVWDNVPVNDGPMRPMLHLGPYVGRAPELPDHVSGLILNPMTSARASAVTLHTAAAYMRDPSGYDAESAWRAAIEDCGGGAPQAFATFAAAHRFSPLLPADRDRELETALSSLRTALHDGTDAEPALTDLRQLVDARVGVAETLRAELADRRLADEIEPWLAAHRGESERLAAAVDLLGVLCADSAALQRVFGFLHLEGKLTRIAPAPVTSYGPRRVLYPQLGSLRDDGAAFGSDRALFVGCNLVDEVIELAEQLALQRLGGR